MPAMLELLTLGIKPRLDVVARLLDQLAALGRQVVNLLNPIASLKAPLELARQRSHRLGPRVMATAHVLHYGLGIPACKVPQVLRVLTGVGLTQSAITQDALRRAARGVVRSMGSCGIRSLGPTWCTSTTPVGGTAACRRT